MAKTIKPTDRQLLRDVNHRHVVHHAGGYDWNNRTGRDVTDAMRRLELAQLVSRIGGELWQCRPTRLGHTVLAASAVETREVA